MKSIPYPAFARAAVLSVLPVHTALAAPGPDTGKIVVTATRQPVRVPDTLADITVIDRAAIAQAGPMSLPQLLAGQAGVQAYSSGGAGKTSGLFIRGASPAQSLLLIDGQRVGSATQGGAALEHIALEDVERIEILRGPASALYGADAMGGVVQIFTRRGAGAFKAEGFAGAGRYGTQKLSANGGGQSGALSVYLGASHEQTDGFSAVADPAKLPFSYDADTDGYRRTALSGQLGWEIAAGHRLNLTAQHNAGRTWYDAQDFMTGAPFDAHADVELSSYGASLASRLSADWTSTLRAGRSIDDSRDVAPWSPDGATFRTEQDQLAWQNDLLTDAGALMLGAEWLQQRARAEGSYEARSRRIAGLFAGWTARWGAHQLQANLRHDDNSDFGAHTTGTLAWGWAFGEGWRVRASAGNAFRAPTFNDLYYPGYANPDLKAERGRSAEAGLNWRGEAGHAALTAYASRVQDQIALDANWVPQNIARAQVDGLSLSGGWREGGWEAEGSAEWMKARDADTGKRLARRAERQAALSASYGLERWRAGAELRWVGERFEDAANTQRMAAYTLTNLWARWRLLPAVQLEARVDNLFDEQYETAWGYGTAGASVFAGLRLTTP